MRGDSSHHLVHSHVMVTQTSRSLGPAVSFLNRHRFPDVADSHNPWSFSQSTSSRASLTRADALMDEDIHLAGTTFQLLGFPHVIGSLWETSDRAAVSVAEEFYKNLVEDLMAPRSRWDGDDGRVVARALHRAVNELRAKNRDPLSWATFLYVGA
ncbi:hypothetical protein BDV12DRAFT_169176 [Aspergillus spectabilis]